LVLLTRGRKRIGAERMEALLSQTKRWQQSAAAPWRTSTYGRQNHGRPCGSGRLHRAGSLLTAGRDRVRVTARPRRQADAALL